MLTRAVDEWYFSRENIINLNAAIIGTSRNNWQSINEESASLETAAEFMREGRFDVLPVVAGERVTGYYQTSRWNDYSSIVRKSLNYRDVIPLQTPIRDLIKGFAVDDRLFYFLSNENRTAGLVTVADLNSRQVRTYLFSLLSELEIRLGEFLLARVPEDELLAMTFSGSNGEKYETVKERFKTDRDNGVEAPFVDYLYLSDLINAIMKKGIYDKLGYPKSQFKESLGSLNELRDTIAHPNRSIITRANTVDRLWRRIDRVEDALFRLRQWQENGA